MCKLYAKDSCMTHKSKDTKNKRWLITLNRKWVLKKWIHFNLEHLKTNRLSIWTYFRSGSKLPKRSIWVLNFKNASTPKPLRGRVLNLVCRGTFECFFTWKHFWSRSGTFTNPQIYLSRLPLLSSLSDSRVLSRRNFYDLKAEY